MNNDNNENQIATQPRQNVFDLINEISQGNINTINEFQTCEQVLEKLESIEVKCRLTAENATERFKGIYDIDPYKLMELLK